MDRMATLSESKRASALRLARCARSLRINVSELRTMAGNHASGLSHEQRAGVGSIASALERAADAVEQSAYDLRAGGGAGPEPVRAVRG